MSEVRAFIAVPIPAEIRTAIQDNTTNLRRALGRPLVRWVPSQNIHLTLKFLGNIDEEKLEPLKIALTRQVAQVQRFTIQFGELGIFPSNDRPRVIWIGADTTDNLQILHKAVETAAGKIGCEADHRPFSAHLTIGRFNQRMSNRANRDKIRHAIEATIIPILGNAEVKTVHLYRSELKSSGAVYSKLHSSRLKES